MDLVFPIFEFPVVVIYSRSLPYQGSASHFPEHTKSSQRSTHFRIIMSTSELDIFHFKYFVQYTTVQNVLARIEVSKLQCLHSFKHWFKAFAPILLNRTTIYCHETLFMFQSFSFAPHCSKNINRKSVLGQKHE